MHDDDLQFHYNQSTMVSCFYSTDKAKRAITQEKLTSC